MTPAATDDVPGPAPSARRNKRSSAVSLSCMEIWGGSEAADNAVSTPGVDFWLHSHPHEDDAAGGDIHYVSVCGHGRYIRTALADVSGHGSVVADLASNLRALVRRHINTPDQSRFARALNDEFGNLSERGAFATAILATYHGPSESLILCNAGHPRPLMRSAETGQWRLLDIKDAGRTAPKSLRNLPLGVIRGTSYEQGVVSLQQGDFVMLYTDALIEAGRNPDTMLGEEGLLELLGAIDFDPADPGRLIKRLLHEVGAHQGDHDFGDDVTIVLLRQNGSTADLSLGEKLGVVAKMLGLKPV